MVTYLQKLKRLYYAYDIKIKHKKNRFALDLHKSVEEVEVLHPYLLPNEQTVRQLQGKNGTVTTLSSKYIHMMASELKYVSKLIREKSSWDDLAVFTPGVIY